MRVAAAARQAKKKYKKFNAADVTPEMIAPEVHVYAWALGLSEGGPSAANVAAVVITPKKGSAEDKAAKAIHPTKLNPSQRPFRISSGPRPTELAA
jgi:hypothetical protein